MLKKVLLFILILSLSVLIIGCDNGDDDTPDYQTTLFKVLDEEGEILESSSLDIEDVNVSGEEGRFKAPLKAGENYNIDLQAERCQSEDIQYKATKGDSNVDFEMEKRRFNLYGEILASGEPVRNADVNLKEIDKSTSTDKKGKFVISEIPSDVYTVVINRDGYNEKKVEVDICKDNVIEIEKADVADDETSVAQLPYVGTDKIDLDTIPARIRGTVLEKDTEDKIKDKTIEVEGKDISVHINEDGKFDKELNPGNYTLIFDFELLDKFEKNISLSAGDTTDLGNIYLKPEPGNIEGVIKNDSNGEEPVKNADIELVNQDDTSTNSDGFFELKNIPPGEYDLSVSHSEFQSITESVKIKRGETTEKEILILSNPGSVKGSTLKHSNIKIGDKEETADSDGNFRVDNLKEGEYELIIDNEDYKTRKENVVINKNKTNDMGTLSLEPKPGSITGETLFGATVYLNESNSFEITDTADYSFEYPEVEVGENLITIVEEDHKTKEIEVEVEPNQDIDLGSIDLEPKPGNISGKVIEDETGDKVDNADVKLKEKNTLITTDSNGEFEFNELEPGNYSIEVTHSDLNDRTVDIEVEKNSTTTEDIELIAKPGSASGTTEPDTNITVLETSDTDTSNSDGNFEIEGLGQGSYTLEVNNNDFKVREIDFEIEKNTKTDLGNISLEPKPGSISGETIPDSTVEFAGETTTADEEGKFSIDDIEVGSYEMVITNPDYEDYTKEYEIEPNYNTDTGTIDLEPLPSDITGVIYSTHYEEGISGADVRIEELGKSTTTNSSGEFSFKDIEEGEYTLLFEDDNHYNDSTTVTLGINEEKDVGTQNLDIKKGSISGSTEPEESSITINGDNDYSTNSKSNGSFSQDNMIPGIYDVTIDHPDYEQLVKSEIEVKPDSDTDMGSIELEPKSGSITGTVRTKVGDNLSDIAVKGAGETTTNSNGEFILDDVEVGTYLLNFEHSDIHDETLSGVEVEPNSTTDVGEIEVEEKQTKGNLEVSVKDEEGNLINSEVTLEEHSDTKTGSTVTWQDLDEGTYTVSADKGDNYLYSSQSVTVVGGSTSKPTITLISRDALSDKGVIEGHATTSHGKPVEDCEVEIGGYGDKTDENGFYQITLPEGNYSEHSYDRDGSGGSGSIPEQDYISVTKQKTKTINIDNLDTVGDVAYVDDGGFGGPGFSVRADYEVDTVEIEYGLRGGGDVDLEVYVKDADGNYLYEVDQREGARTGTETVNLSNKEFGSAGVSIDPITNDPRGDVKISVK